MKTACQSQHPKFFQVIDEKPISKASGIDRKQLQKNIMDDLNKNIHYPECPKVLQEEIMRWVQKIQEKEEKKRLKE